tara:strand:- start:105 stop:335 length:231 start_codon:yes stop_codon:yes gene_type:complete
MFKINILAFILSFAIGVFFVYTTMPDEKQIMVYPSPDNIDHIQYKDGADNCFAFKQTKSQCPTDKSSIMKTPIQTS